MAGAGVVASAGSGVAGVTGAGRNMSVQALLQLPSPARAAYAQAFTASLDTVFLVAAIVCAIAFVITWLLPERPLRGADE